MSAQVDPWVGSGWDSALWFPRSLLVVHSLMVHSLMLGVISHRQACGVGGADQSNEVTMGPGLLGSVATPRAEGQSLLLGLTP